MRGISAVKPMRTTIEKLIVIVCMCMSAVTSAYAQKENAEAIDYILVVGSYIEDDTWSGRITSAATEFAKKDNRLAVYTEYMNMLLISDSTDLQGFKDEIFRKYDARPPRIVLLLGSFSLVLRDDIREHWGDIPLLVCSENNFTASLDTYLEKQIIAEEKRIPLSDLAQPYNLTLMHSDFFVEENIRLISRMIPRMKKFIFIGDMRGINLENESITRTFVRQQYPDVDYEYISPKSIEEANQLIDELNTVDPKTTGILFSSWYFKYTFAGYTTIHTNAYKLIGTTVPPVFSLGIIDLMNDRAGMVGGYIYDRKIFYQQLENTLTAILSGKQPRDIPFYRPTTGRPMINYENLLLKNLSPDRCPADTVFINKPLTVLEEYGDLLFGIAILLIVGILFVLYRFSAVNKLKNVQQKRLDVVAEFESLFRNMPVLYVQKELIMNEQGVPVDLIYRKMNPVFEQAFRFDKTTIGAKMSDLFPEMLPDFLHFVQLALKENKAISFPYYVKVVDSFFNIVLKRTVHEGLVDVFCLDSTELQKAQRLISTTNNKLSMALDIANIVPWKWDLVNHKILCDINRPLELQVFGEEIAEEQLEIPDSHYFSRILREDRSRVEQAYEDLLEGRSKKVKEEFRVVTIENNTYKTEWVEAQAAIGERDAEGKPLSLVGSSLVITERKNLEFELTSAKDRAEESNRLKSAFLANMSHEIRTPLNAIVGFSNILATADEAQERQEYISIIENNNTLLLQLINDILDLSKIEAGTLEFIYTNVELNGLMRELENTLRLKSKSDKVLLSFMPPAIDKCFVRLEKNRVSQLIINLVTNAIKFTEEGSIRFGYEIKKGELYFYVSDTGCGIPRDKQENIFGRFVKLNAFAQGTGLGLSICNTLVETMGGKIGVHSEEGLGSTFWFTLPYEPVEIKQDDNAEKVTPIKVEKDKLTILIAEDNSSNYMLFKTTLERDYCLVHAWNGQEAVELFQKHNPQIVLMDINMPVMDGYEAASEIRKLSTQVPIIAVTAFAYASDEQRVMENGFDGYMSKPINARQLKDKILDVTQTRFVLL